MKIVLTGGGTAGHVMPHIALLPRIERDFDEIHYIGGNGMEKDIIAQYPQIKFHEISCGKFDRAKFSKNFVMPIKVIKGICQSKKLLKEIRPDVIFSKGGFVALPVVFASNKKIPVITHESDLTIGLANRLMLKKCRKVLTSFEDTAKPLKSGVFTGSPLRDELFGGNRQKGLRMLGFDGRRPILLVTGGSLGAKAINSALRQNLSVLTSRFDIVHLTGKGNKDNSLESSAYRQIEFTPDIADIFSAADIALSRAGSNAIMELMAIKKPTLLIPLPASASRGDQIANAEYLRKRGLARVLDQSEINTRLVQELDALHQSRAVLTAEMQKHNFCGTDKIYTEILDAAKN